MKRRICKQNQQTPSIKSFMWRKATKNKMRKRRKRVRKTQKKKTLERKQRAAVKTFQQLSTAQNAFTGLSGTGFSSSSFSFDTKIIPFGSTPKFGSFSTGSAFTSASSTGSMGGTGCLFGTKLNTDDLAPRASFGNTDNSYAPLQLFGTPATDNISRSGSGFGALPEVPVETGEEKEKPVFTADATLFQYINGGWKERGKGELRLNIPTADTGRARLVMRARGNYRLILNANIYPDMKLTGMEKRGFTFACFNNAGEAIEGLATFALKFKDSSIADDFQAATEAHKGRSLTESKTRENLSMTGEPPLKLNEARES
uniref:TSA: Wollemia nobilis Ref_Wollemi_Transcript_15314_2303 transcribed RNA sequence n=1 Tax=Wollemia nobilis TaxID=56998 RepID=A0A0C9S3C7_9CONI